MIRVLISLALMCCSVGLVLAGDPTRPASAAETAMSAVADLAISKVKGSIRMEFVSVTEENSLAHQDERTYSGRAQLYDRDDKPLGTWGFWSARVIRKDGKWKVDKDSLEFRQPKPTPVKR